MKNKYSKLSVDEQINHIGNFPVDNFSHSSLRKFCQNQYDFKKRYIDKNKDGKITEGMIIGSAFHKVLEVYFSNRSYDWGIIELSNIADDYIDNQNNDYLKITKKWKDKSIEEYKENCKRYAKLCVNFFFDEKKKWFDENVELVIGIEFNYKGFIDFETIDYDIPLPVNMYIDLIFIDKQGFLCATDYKTGLLTDKVEVELSEMQQMIIYNSGVSASFENDDFLKMWEDVFKKYPKGKNGLKYFYVFQVKKSKNKNGDPQTRIHKIEMEKVVGWYEAFVFNQMQSFFNAISDPKHIYAININDNMCDKVSIAEHFINEYHGSSAFNLQKNKQIQKNVNNIARLMISELKENSQFLKSKNMDNATNEEKIQHKLSLLGCFADVKHTIEAHSCVIYLIKPKANTSVKKIVSRKDDIADALDVKSVRIGNSLIEYQGSSYIGAELNKKQKERTYPDTPPKSDKINIGVSTMGEVIHWNYKEDIHLMIAGATKSGKSVLINSIIKQSEGFEKIILDPKREFRNMKNSYQELNDIVLQLNLLVDKMKKLYKENKEEKIFLIFDEANSVFSETKNKKNYDGLLTPQDCLTIIVSMGRACGIHVIMAGQRITSKLFSGDCKSNFLARISLTTATSLDSSIMGFYGSEKLIMKGDALFVDTEHKEPIRIQCYSY